MLLYFYLIALGCEMKKRPDEVVAADTDYETAFKSSLINCTTMCLRDAKCKAAYYSNGFCFIIYKYTPTLNPYTGSSYFDKVCNFTYRKYDILCQFWVSTVDSIMCLLTWNVNAGQTSKVYGHAQKPMDLSNKRNVSFCAYTNNISMLDLLL